MRLGQLGVFDRNKVKKNIIIFFIVFIIFDSYSQNFYREKEPKSKFYEIGLGVGTFFSTPRPSYDSLNNERAPVFSIGLGKKVTNYFSLKSSFSFQPFSSKEVILKENGVIDFEPIFKGYSYALDITPTFNLLPSYHHMSRPIIDIQVGLGVGYLLTYRTETFTYQEKKYDFSFFESSFYFPIRISTAIRVGNLSDLVLEGVFFYTFLDGSRKGIELKKDSDHFGQMNVKFRKYFR